MNASLESFFAWGEAHPQLFGILLSAFVWPAITGAVSFAQDWLKAKSPKAWDIVQRSGFDALGLIREHWPKRFPGPPPGAASAIVWGIGLGLAIVALTGCATPLRSAAEVSNYAAVAGAEAQQMVHDKCTAPMQSIAAEPASPERRDKALALAKTCDPVEDSYAAFRQAHLALVAAIVRAQTSQGITVGDLIAITDTAAQSLLSMEKAIRAQSLKAGGK